MNTGESTGTTIMRTQEQKINTKSKTGTIRSLRSSMPQYSHPIVQLQQKLGNQAIQRLLQSRHIQVKLTIGQSNDIYEQEADKVADQVMRMPESLVASSSHRVQPKNNTFQNNSRRKGANVRFTHAVDPMMKVDRPQGGVQGLSEQVIQREEGKKSPENKFESMVNKEAENEYEKIKAKYKKEGMTERVAAFHAIDDMFAERLKATGGKRTSGSATMPSVGEKIYLHVSSPMKVSGVTIEEGLQTAGIDDKSYNCHSYTFTDAKTSKYKKLKTLAKTIPAGPVKGKKYYDTNDLISNKIHFDLEMGLSLMIYPRWIANVDEVKTFLKGYKKRKTGEKLSTTKENVALYTTNGDYPHSGKVTKIDKKGNPIKVKGKWGHYSLFEHDPEAVPSYYGTPNYYRKK